jgi:hypothetical protein
MDTEVTWKVSEDFDGLLEAVLTCKRELTKLCFAKFGSAKISEYKVFAPQKICELLQYSERFKPYKSKELDSYCHKVVAEFEQFKLFKTKMFGDRVVRVEAKFEVGEGIGKYWYGDVVLT